MEGSVAVCPIRYDGTVCAIDEHALTVAEVHRDVVPGGDEPPPVVVVAGYPGHCQGPLLESYPVSFRTEVAHEDTVSTHSKGATPLTVDSAMATLPSTGDTTMKLFFSDADTTSDTSDDMPPTRREGELLREVLRQWEQDEALAAKFGVAS